MRAATPFHGLLMAGFLALPGLAPAQAPDPADAAAADGSSERVEESDEAYRRRMELEDARARDPMQSPAVDIPPASLEKIDKLPQASQENIRDQVIDVIMENDEWEPFDALREFPYTPTEAAQRDPDLLAREQAAWDEQIEKYHQREAAAHAARRGPVPGAGNPDGPEGGAAEGGDRGQAVAGAGGGQGSGGAEGQQGEGQEGGGAAGTYQPYEPNRTAAEESVSTAGVQQSALDFIRGGTGSPAAAASSDAAAASDADTASNTATAGTEAAVASAATSEEASPETDDLRGLVAIEDLDKLEDAASGEAPPPEPPEDD